MYVYLMYICTYASLNNYCVARRLIEYMFQSHARGHLFVHDFDEYLRVVIIVFYARIFTTTATGSSVLVYVKYVRCTSIIANYVQWGYI